MYTFIDCLYCCGQYQRALNIIKEKDLHKVIEIRLRSILCAALTLIYYLRKNISLADIPHSSESQVSRFTLSANEDKTVELKPNNSFLHDNVD